MQISEITKNNESHISKTQSKNEFPLSASEIQQYKQTFDSLSQQKKKNYLHAIQCHNQELVNKIKELDRRINSDMDALSKKIVPHQKRKSGAQRLFQQVETQQLTAKFQEYQKLRRELEVKKTGIDSLQFLLLVKKEENMKIADLDRQIVQLKGQIQKIQKIKQKSQLQQSTLKKQLLRVGQFSMFDDEIEQLRKKVKEKNQQIKSKKQEFLSVYRRNRSNRSMHVDQLPQKSKMEEPDKELAQLRRNYIWMGKKIQHLKNKKASLQKSIPSAGQLQRQLQKLKQKYQTLSRLSK